MVTRNGELTPCCCGEGRSGHDVAWCDEEGEEDENKDGGEFENCEEGCFCQMLVRLERCEIRRCHHGRTPRASVVDE